MDASVLDQHVARAKSDPAFFQELTSNPGNVISNFDEIERKVLGAIASMSPEKGMGELLGASSNDHCPRCSCGQTSYVSLGGDGSFLRP